VPRGLVPQGMTIAGEDQSLVDQIFSDIAEFLATLGLPFSRDYDNGLGVAGDDEQVTFVYDYDRDLVIGQPLPITLDVVGEVAANFTVEGRAEIATQLTTYHLPEFLSVDTMADNSRFSFAQVVVEVLSDESFCPAVINLRDQNQPLNVRLTPGGEIIFQIAHNTSVSLLGLNLNGVWAYIEVNGQRGWADQTAVNNGNCVNYQILADDGSPVPPANYDFIIDPIPQSFSTADCRAFVPESEGEAARILNNQNCSRVVLHFFSTKFSVDEPMMMSDILSAVYAGELSVLSAASGEVAMGLREYGDVSAWEIGREALINNFWAVAYELRRPCLEATDCVFTLTPQEIVDSYLYQVQSWYQNALPFQDNTGVQLLETYYSNSRSQRGLAFQALSSADRLIEGRPWQWGNYGFGNPVYENVQNEPSVVYCYTVRSFTGDASDGVTYAAGTEFWDDYKFIILTTRAAGRTSTFDIQGGANRPGWVDGVIYVQAEDTTLYPIPYTQYILSQRGTVYVPCNISANDVYSG
jgi:hypothetical protein